VPELPSLQHKLFRLPKFVDERLMPRKVIVSCNPYFGPSLRPWFGPEVTGDDVQWLSFDDRPVYCWERKIKKPNLATARAALEAVLASRRQQAKLLFIQDARLAFWCGIISLFFRSRIPYCAFTFNFPELPSGVKRFLMSVAFRRINEFFVHSSMERALYSSYFGVPIARFKVRLWSIDKPEVSPLHSQQTSPYISAIGGNGRDYKTLFEAAGLLPHIPLVVVARPESLQGLSVPRNVKVLCNVPLEEAMNILKFSAFTVLPLKTSTVPCGHVTLVCAMHLGKAVVATDSEGISDYLIPEYNAILYKAGSPQNLAAAMERLWNDPEMTARLAACNEEYGALHCTENKARADLAELMIRHDLLTETALRHPSAI
jgi:glycosyltransferase involved in cell wall biosynthesis